MHKGQCAQAHIRFITSPPHMFQRNAGKRVPSTGNAGKKECPQKKCHWLGRILLPAARKPSDRMRNPPTPTPSSASIAGVPGACGPARDPRESTSDSEASSGPGPPSAGPPPPPPPPRLPWPSSAVGASGVGPVPARRWRRAARRHPRPPQTATATRTTPTQTRCTARRRMHRHTVTHTAHAQRNSCGPWPEWGWQRMPRNSKSIRSGICCQRPHHVAENCLSSAASAPSPGV